MTYIDGFVAAVKTAGKETYRAHCRLMGGVFKEHGALEVVDTWGDDVPEGKLTSFTMADTRMAPGATPMPFDGKRMVYGGFELLSKT